MACWCVSAVLIPVITASAADNRPNIIFIMADDLGYGHLGCYGQTLIRTPNLDRLATEGMRFTQAYAGSCVCASSRSVLMTGLHGGHSPVRGNSGGIPIAPGDVTVAEVLESAGYATGLIGKWGLGEHGTTGVPYKQGFDEFFGYLHQIHAHFYYPEYLWHNDQRFMLEGNDGMSGRHVHDELADRALDYVRRHKNERFFLYLPFAMPHYELLVPEDSLREYAGRWPETPYTGRNNRPAGYPSDYAPQAQPRAATAAMITRMDRSVGRLMALLEELDLERRTIVFFTSDNGATPGPSDPPFFNATGGLRGTKGTLYEGGIRTPMIVRWPDKIQAGSVNEHIWSFTDVMPTLAELGGGTSPENIDGVSVAPTLLGEKAAGRKQKMREYFYWEHSRLRAVRAGRWKAVTAKPGFGPNPAIELYDLEKDRGEQHDVADANAEVTARMRRYLTEAHVKPRPQIEPKKPPGRQYQ
jgi:arylsulfatase A-like enzyme